MGEAGEASSQSEQYGSLFESAESGDLAAIRRLEAEGGGLSLAECTKCMRIATRDGRLEVVNYLAELALVEDEFAQLAIEHGHFGLARRLVELGADPRADGDRCLQLAVERGDLGTVKYLAGLGADIRDARRVAWAARLGHLPVVEYLAGLGADLWGRRCLSLRFAAEWGRAEVVEYIIAQRTTPWPALDLDECVRAAAYGGHLEIVRRLVGLGGDPHSMDNYCIEQAAAGGHAGVVEYLVGLGSIPRANIEQCLISAASGGHIGVIKVLWTAGANARIPNMRMKGDQLMDIAAARGHIPVIQYLLGHGPPSHLMWMRTAIKNDKINIIKWLGAWILLFPERANNRINEFVVYADSFNRVEIVKYLNRQGKLSISVSSLTGRYLAYCARAEPGLRKKAAATLYFWWVPRCFGLARQSGRRTRARNYRKYQRICTAP